MLFRSGIAFSEHSSSTTHPANLPSAVENAAERNMSQLSEALPTQVELQGTRAPLRQTVDLPADSHMYPAQGVQDVSTDQASGQFFAYILANANQHNLPTSPGGEYFCRCPYWTASDAWVIQRTPFPWPGRTSMQQCRQSLQLPLLVMMQA